MTAIDMLFTLLEAVFIIGFVLVVLFWAGLAGGVI